jgi:Flp pilus assembly CpaF family ATPase
MTLFCARPELDGVIRRILGEVVCRYLDDPAVQELSANYDPTAKLCQLFVDDGTGAMRPLDAALEPSAIITIRRMLATVDGQSLQPDAPFLNCVLANGFRFHAAFGQVTDGPSFSIRAYARLLQLRPLSDFMTGAQAALIEKAILSRKTSLIGGGRTVAK